MENVEYKFQILFVFGQSYMSKDAAKNLTKEWQLENKEHHDLIIAGMGLSCNNSSVGMDLLHSFMSGLPQPVC